MSQFNLSWPANIQSNIQTTLDSIMNNIEGQPCILTYPPLAQPISNGQGLGSFGPILTDVWSAGSPLPLNSQQSIGTYGDGQDYLEISVTGTITMVVYTDPSKFNNIFPIGIRKDDNMIMTRGFVSDLQNVINAVKMSTYLMVGDVHYDYKLAGEPVMPGTIIPGRYFYALWSRCGAT